MSTEKPSVEGLMELLQPFAQACAFGDAAERIAAADAIRTYATSLCAPAVEPTKATVESVPPVSDADNQWFGDMMVLQVLADSKVVNEQEREVLTRWLATSQRPSPLASPSAPQPAEGKKLWLWKNFVDGKPEYWAFDNPFPINLNDGDPQTLGEPCGYAVFKPSREGRTDWTEEKVLRAIARAREA
jgi:hypothetical protein